MQIKCTRTRSVAKKIHCYYHTKPEELISPASAVFSVFTMTLNRRWRNEAQSQGQVVLAEMNGICWGYNECDRI